MLVSVKCTLSGRIKRFIIEFSSTLVSLIKSGSGCTVALEPLDLGPSFMAQFLGLWTELAENLSELWNSQTVAMEITKNCLALGKNQLYRWDSVDLLRSTIANSLQNMSKIHHVVFEIWRPSPPSPPQPSLHDVKCTFGATCLDAMCVTSGRGI